MALLGDPNPILTALVYLVAAVLILATLRLLHDRWQGHEYVIEDAAHEDYWAWRIRQAHAAETFEAEDELHARLYDQDQEAS